MYVHANDAAVALLQAALTGLLCSWLCPITRYWLRKSLFVSLSISRLAVTNHEPVNEAVNSYSRQFS